MQHAARSWINAKPIELSDAMPVLLGAVNDNRVAGEYGALSMANQLLHWHAQVGSASNPDADRQRRVDYLVAISQEWDAALGAYIADDGGQWRMPRSAVRP